MEVEQVLKAFELNTLSILRVSKAVADHMAQKGRGTIVTIGSIAAYL